MKQKMNNLIKRSVSAIQRGDAGRNNIIVLSRIYS